MRLGPLEAGNSNVPAGCSRETSKGSFLFMEVSHVRDASQRGFLGSVDRLDCAHLGKALCRSIGLIALTLVMVLFV